MIDWMEKLLDFSGTLNASIAASWLILAVIGLRLLLKKAPKWVNVALWGIVALRLLMPFSVESALSLIPSAQTVSGEILQAGPVPGREPAYLEIVTNPSFGNGVSVELDTSISSFQWNLLELNFLWFAGMGVMALYTAITYFSLRRKLRTAVILRDQIFQCETVHSPFVLGILRPRIYLPYGMEDPHVIAHEMAHIRRKDHWWKPLGFLLLSIHWFNPLMWLAYVLLCRDIELACDEKVIAELDSEQRADYTQALVACSVNRRSIAACPLAFGEVGVKERVKSIMNYRKPTFWIVLIALAVCAAVAVCFLTDPITGSSAQKWFDYTEDNSEMSYEQELTIQLEEFPDVTFCYVPGELTAETADGVRTRLFDGMPIWSVYFCDLNGDGYPEICSESSFGSGIIDERITVYDYANGRSYLLSGRGEYDYYLRLDEGNGQLYVDKHVYNSSELVSSEPLRLEDFAIQIDTQPRVTLTARILEIRDGYFLVEPLDGSEGPDRIEVPMQNMEPSPEPLVGDTLQIEYDGMLQETYPVRIASVYHISVAERIPMVPTDTELTGLHAGVLLVPIDGSIYRYNLRESDPQNVTADALLLRFEEIDMGKAVDNQVFSLKEYPDRTKVLLISERNGALLCEYSPPLRCSESALNDAIASGFVVEENGLATHGQDIWQEFYEKTCQGTESSVTVASYHTLDPERCTAEYCEVFRQDYPFLNICELQFDGSRFALINNGGCGVYSYEYLMKYETPIHSVFSSMEPVYAYRYVLTHDNRLTYDELWQSAASSQYGAYIDHFQIYSERKTD